MSGINNQQKEMRGPDPTRRKTLLHRFTCGIISDPWVRKPWGVRWRSSPWFITGVVCLGIATDLLTYTIIVPVIPYRLQSLQYQNIATLTSILLICYSGGLAVGTPVFAFVFHLYPYRRAPLLFSLVILQLSFILFMLAPPYWCMCIARVIQGVSSALIWNIGLVLIVENVAEENVGRQVGFAMSGVAVGTTLGPVIGGTLYDKLGWHAPFIFCIACSTVDFVGRVLVIEAKEVKRWGVIHGEPALEQRDLEKNAGIAKGEKEKAVVGKSDGVEEEKETEAVDAEVDLGMDKPTETMNSSLTLPTDTYNSGNQIPTTSSASTSAVGTALVRTPSKPNDSDLAVTIPPANTTRQIDLSITSPSSSITPSKPELHHNHTDPISVAKKELELTPLGVLVKLGSSKRGMTSFLMVFAYGLVIGSQDPSLTLRVEQTWNKSSLFVGLIYLAAAVPTFSTGPIFGALADKWGAEVLTTPVLVCALPFFPLLILKESLAGFIVVLTIGNAFLSTILAPVGLELAQVSKTQEGIGELHQFGAFNMAFAVATCIGPIFGGQIYDHFDNGWTILSWLWLAFIALCIPPAMLYVGERPLAGRIKEWMKRRKEARGSDTPRVDGL